MREPVVTGTGIDRRNGAAIVRALVPILALITVLTACSGSDETGKAASRRVGTRGADSAGADGLPRDSLVATLARAAGGAEGRVYQVQGKNGGGVITGRVTGGAPHDTSITPTHDLSVCRPFTETLVPSRNGGVGNGVVWLVGVAAGPPDDAPRRVRLELTGCRLVPRVQRVVQGGTVMLSSRDAMMTRLRFVELSGDGRPHGTIRFSDAGQVVPTSDVAASAGIVMVRDDLHPWVRGYLAIAPHPFVAVTEPDGLFRFIAVPAGRYTLVVWHEALGARALPVKVENGVEMRVELSY